MKELTNILINATQMIERQYFHLKIDGGDPVYRERVYCYELYHQMRSIWPTDTEYYLNGEIDKVAHPILKRLRTACIKPDLLIHKPGYMSGNYAIIEVKTKNASNQGIKKDLESLSIFINQVYYKRAIYLIYGYQIKPDSLLEKIISISNGVKDLAEIELWLHTSDSQPAFHAYTLCAIKPVHDK